MSDPVIPPRWWEQPCIEYTGAIPARRGNLYAEKPIPYRIWLNRETRYEPYSLEFDHWPIYDKIVFCMLNPSTARADKGDPTDRKCNGFAAHLGARSYGIVNPFARSTPYPRELFVDGVEVAIGEHNRAFLRNVLVQAKARNWPVIMAHGSQSKLNAMGQAALFQMVGRIVRTADALDVPLYALALTPDGHPRHPLMLGYEQFELQTWRQP